MPIKYSVDKLEDVPENLRSLYRSEGNKFVLDAEGVVPKERLDEFRNNNIALQQQIDKIKDIDPAKYRELVALQRKIEEKELIDKGDVDKVVELRVRTMKETLESELNTTKQTLATAQAQLGTLLIDNVIKSAAIKNGVLPEAVDDIVLRAKGLYTIVDGQPVPKDATGKVIYGKDGTNPMPVEEWVISLKNTAKHLFATSRGSGAGGGHGTGATNTANLTPAQKISLGLAAGGLQTKLPGT